MHSMNWVWLIMVPPLMVSHVDWYRCVERREEVVGTCECKEIRVTHQEQAIRENHMYWIETMTH